LRCRLERDIIAISFEPENNLAQIVVRGIDDKLMRRFKERAKARGKSAEQAVRELIENAARDYVRTVDWLARADELRERLRREYGSAPITAAELIREDRDNR
jgi:plasmid stability protein